jgi:serine/threonine protein kinase/WD40 repeat protein
MTPERWQQVKKLLEAAWERDAGERGAFLDQACADDPELRSEVEALLASDEHGGEFLAAPAMDQVESGAIEQVPENSSEGSDLAGTRVGRYTIQGLIGKGGMGAVYRAVREDDFRMQVAIKLLKRGTDTDAALGRFRAERQILAGLQHPNIARLLDGGATETGSPYFVMEYVDGAPLLEYAAPLTVPQRLQLFRSVCSAVQYAHQNRIVHRDIKPANILVTSEGIPKLLDFGIAKLLHPATDGATVALTLTGARVMTPDYASPEQVKGEPVTPATDVYSLGTVLYELLTGKRAHHVKAYSLEEMLKEICTQDPPKPSSVVKELDGDLDNIVLRALRKEPERRYGSAAELSEDLDRFLHHRPVHARKESLTYRGRKFLKRNRVPTVAAGLSAVLILALVVGLGGFGLRRSGLPQEPFQNLRMTRITPDGKAGRAAISPQGDYVAHSHKEEDGRQSLWVRNVSTSSDVQIVPPANVDYGNMAFSTDGSDIYFTTRESRFVRQADLNKVPALGGPARKLRTVDHLDLQGTWVSTFAVSPDSAHLALTAGGLGWNELLITARDGSGGRTIAGRHENDVINGVAWSPDAHTIAFGRVNLKTFDTEIMTVAAEGGPERALTHSNLNWRILSLQWLQNDWLAVLSTPTTDPYGSQIWRVSYPAGHTARITNDLSKYTGLSATKAGNPIATVQTDYLCNLWILPAGRSDAARQITYGPNKYDGYNGISWAPNGTLFFGSRAIDGRELWQIQADGQDLRPLPIVSSVAWVQVSPDGRSIAFLSDRGGTWRIRKADVNGENAAPVANGFSPSWSPDGQWILYYTIGPPVTSWKQHVTGGAPVPILRDASAPVVSPDGKWIFCWLYEDNKTKIAIVSFTDGRMMRKFDLPPGLSARNRLSWMPDGKAFAYIADRGGISNIFAQPIDGSDPMQITRFSSGMLFSFAWSRDGSQLACARGGITSDVVLIHDLR